MQGRKRSRKPPAVFPEREGSADAELSFAEVERLMRDAADGDPVAQCRLGRFFLSMGREFDGMNYFRYAAYQGHEPAWLEIGAMCGKDSGVPGTHEDVAKWYIPAAETGNPTAQLALAGLYREGFGVDPDPVECTRLYRLSADQGDPEAQFQLGLRYLQGTGVKRNANDFTKWLIRAVEGGHLAAQTMMGHKYLHGIGVKADFDEGIRLLTGCAEQGDMDSITILVAAYITGSACREDLNEAAKWLRTFIDLTSPESSQDYARHLVSIAQKPSPYPLLAHIYFSLAGAAGSSSARRDCNLLERQLSAREVEKSHALTRMCHPYMRRKWRSSRTRKRR